MMEYIFMPHNICRILYLVNRNHLPNKPALTHLNHISLINASFENMSSKLYLSIFFHMGI